MKTIVQSNNDIIINHSKYPVRVEGKIKWEDESKTLTKVKNQVHNIKIYTSITINEYGTTQTTVVNLSAYEIKELYEKVKALEETEYISDYALEDDLPF